jgi:hypothetical protein
MKQDERAAAMGGIGRWQVVRTSAGFAGISSQAPACQILAPLIRAR